MKRFVFLHDLKHLLKTDGLRSDGDEYLDIITKKNKGFTVCLY